MKKAIRLITLGMALTIVGRVPIQIPTSDGGGGPVPTCWPGQSCLIATNAK